MCLWKCSWVQVGVVSWGHSVRSPTSLGCTPGDQLHVLDLPVRPAVPRALDLETPNLLRSGAPGGPGEQAGAPEGGTAWKGGAGSQLSVT